jgi:hypothetical protein
MIIYVRESGESGTVAAAYAYHLKSHIANGVLDVSDGYFAFELEFTDRNFYRDFENGRHAYKYVVCAVG